METILDTVITDQYDAPVKDQLEMQENGGTVKFLTVRSAASHALFFSFPEDTRISNKEKYLRGDLGLRLFKGESALTPEEITLVKDLVGRLYSPLVMVQIYKLLDSAIKS